MLPYKYCKMCDEQNNNVINDIKSNNNKYNKKNLIYNFY